MPIVSTHANRLTCRAARLTAKAAPPASLCLFSDSATVRLSENDRQGPGWRVRPFARQRENAAKSRARPIGPGWRTTGISVAAAQRVTPLPTSATAQSAVTVRRADDIGAAIVSVPATGVDLEAVERALIVFALDATGGNRTHAARLLRLTRSALLYRMQKYGLTGDKVPE